MTEQLTSKQVKALEKALKKYDKIRQKWDKEDERTKQQIIRAIQSMTEFIDLYEDDQQTIPTTEQHLQQKTITELIETFDEMIQLIKNEATRM